MNNTWYPWPNATTGGKHRGRFWKARGEEVACHHEGKSCQQTHAHLKRGMVFSQAEARHQSSLHRKAAFSPHCPPKWMLPGDQPKWVWKDLNWVPDLHRSWALEQFLSLICAYLLVKQRKIQHYHPVYPIGSVKTEAILYKGLWKAVCCMCAPCQALC